VFFSVFLAVDFVLLGLVFSGCFRAFLALFSVFWRVIVLVSLLLSVFQRFMFYFCLFRRRWRSVFALFFVPPAAALYFFAPSFFVPAFAGYFVGF
jgi:hypothetical protein